MPTFAPSLPVNSSHTPRPSVRVLLFLSPVLVGLALFLGSVSSPAQSAATPSPAPSVTPALPAAAFTAGYETPIAPAGTDTAAVASAYRSWVSALGKAHGNPASMLKYYAPEAILIATYSPNLLHNAHGDLASYYKKFTSLPNLQCATQELETRVYTDWAINTGLYTFSHDTLDGQQVFIPARFTFVYRKFNGQWLIVDQHSSLVPPGF